MAPELLVNDDPITTTTNDRAELELGATVHMLEWFGKLYSNQTVGESIGIGDRLLDEDGWLYLL